MALIFSTNTTTATTLALTGGAYILSGVNYLCTASNDLAFTASGGGAYLDNAGFLVGGLSFSGAGNYSVVNRAGATLMGQVVMFGANNQIVNSGLMSNAAAGFPGIIVQSADTTTSTITNNASGRIEGASVGLARLNAPSTGTIMVRNYGLISANDFAYDGSGNGSALASDIIYNAGSIVGDVNLGAGEDRYDGSRGTIDGTVLGGDGRDVFLPGAGSEIFDGGASVDQVNFSRSTNAVQVFLDGSGVNNGLAAGDTYIGIETFVGTARDDTFVGDENSNIFFGGGGADRLEGGGGSDFLVGGLGNDTLFGGEGNDNFIYNSPLEGSLTETIFDFANRTGDNDTIRVSAAGFGGGLTAGAPLTAAQFIAFSGTFADTADTRFYFDTTQSILSYDADGSGTAFGRVALCKLFIQSGVFSQADFVVVA